MKLAHEAQESSNTPHTIEHEIVIHRYQEALAKLPDLNRLLLLYLLDLMAVFASKSVINKATAPVLASIFQPALLNRPGSSDSDRTLSQAVILFLIENQEWFLTSMMRRHLDHPKTDHPARAE